MKKLIRSFSYLFLFIAAGCSQDEIIPSKPGEALLPVEDLAYSIVDNNVVLTWKLPGSFSDAIVQPVAVQVKIAVDGQNAGTHVLENAPESYSYSTYDPSKKYRFTVKVRGDVDTSDPYVTNLRYSPGKTVAF